MSGFDLLVLAAKEGDWNLFTWAELDPARTRFLNFDSAFQIALEHGKLEFIGHLFRRARPISNQWRVGFWNGARWAPCIEAERRALSESDPAEVLPTLLQNLQEELHYQLPSVCLIPDHIKLVLIQGGQVSVFLRLFGRTDIPGLTASALMAVDLPFLHSLLQDPTIPSSLSIFSLVCNLLWNGNFEEAMEVWPSSSSSSASPGPLIGANVKLLINTLCHCGRLEPLLYFQNLIENGMDPNSDEMSYRLYSLLSAEHFDPSVADWVEAKGLVSVGDGSLRAALMILPGPSVPEIFRRKSFLSLDALQWALKRFPNVDLRYADWQPALGFIGGLYEGSIFQHLSASALFYLLKQGRPDVTAMAVVEACCYQKDWTTFGQLLTEFPEWFRPFEMQKAMIESLEPVMVYLYLKQGLSFNQSLIDLNLFNSPRIDLDVILCYFGLGLRPTSFQRMERWATTGLARQCAYFTFRGFCEFVTFFDLT